MGPTLGNVCIETESLLGREIVRCEASLHKLSNSDQMTKDPAIAGVRTRLDDSGACCLI